MNKDNLSPSDMSGYGEILSSVTPYQQRIHCKNKRYSSDHGS